MQKKIILAALMLLALASCAALVYAQPPPENEGSLASGYRVTSDWHGIDTPLGSDVTANATTTDGSVVAVMFLWKDPEGGIQQNHTDNTPTVCGTYDGKTVYCFEDTFNGVDIMGDWGVQALFIGPGGTVKEQVSDVIAIRATSFNVIPEVPILGTIGASAAMLAGFTYKMKRKPQK
jgi:hypothetical protein